MYSLYNRHKPACGIPVRVDLQSETRLTNTLKEIGPDVIVHAAALTDVDLCEKDRDLALTVNYVATRAIAHTAKRSKAFVVYVSTDYVFDGDKGMYNEGDTPAPVNFYGITKLRGEKAIKEECIDHLIVRSSVIFGSTPSSGKTNFALWVLGKLARREHFGVLKDQFVSPTLNSNLAEMLLDAIQRRITGTLHLAGASRVNRLEMARTLAVQFRMNAALVDPVLMRDMKWSAKRPRDSSLDTSKARSVLKIKPLSIGDAISTLARTSNILGERARRE